MSKGKVRVLDTTLRDGSHAMAHQFTSGHVSQIAGALDQTGVSIIEVTHGAGLGGSTRTFGFSKEPNQDLLRAAAKVVKNAKLAVLLVPGVGTQEDLEEAYELGVRVVRLATHCTEADVTEQHFKFARELGMDAFGLLMMSHMASPEALLEQAKLMESYGCQCVVVTDSAGNLRPDDIRRRVSMLRNGLGISVGVHCHNNLGLAVGNTLAGVEEGADYADGCTMGLGAGAGNTPTEVLATVLEMEGYETGLDQYKLQETAEHIVQPIMPRPQIIDRASLMLGYAGVYSSFLLHTYHAAARFNVEVQDILAELGRRQVVAGQEDVIVDVATQLAKNRAANR